MAAEIAKWCSILSTVACCLLIIGAICFGEAGVSNRLVCGAIILTVAGLYLRGPWFNTERLHK
ncbi:MAG: hypothetical protein AAGJ83_08460 [Planctomycetota bacterium]